LKGDTPELEGYSVHDIAGVLKLFLRELEGVYFLLFPFFFIPFSEPLIPYALYDNFLGATQIESKPARIALLRSLVVALPKKNKEIMDKFIGLLHDIAQKSQDNRMTASNLAVIVGPNIMKSSNAEDYEKMLMDSKPIGQITEDIIANYKLLFSVRTISFFLFSHFHFKKGED